MYSSKKRGHWHILLWAALLLAAALWCKSAFGSRDFSGDAAVAIKAAVERSALQCYAVEGVYPPGLPYLEEHYGLRINREDYFVIYEIFASNIPPEVQVLKRKQ